jgi:hypothetical protein
VHLQVRKEDELFLIFLRQMIHSFTVPRFLNLFPIFLLLRGTGPTIPSLSNSLRNSLMLPSVHGKLAQGEDQLPRLEEEHTY